MTTVGLGDIVPRRPEFLPLSILLMTLGVALTTIFIDAASGLFKRLHYFGVRLRNVKGAVIWFGGKQLSVGKLINNVGKKFGLQLSSK